MKTVLITGASRGIGRAAAILFSENGYNVIANYNKSESAAKELEKYNITTIKADVSDYSQVKKMFEKIKETCGGVDILINNAGIAMQKMFCDTEPTDWENIFSVNVTGMYNTAHCAVDYMVDKKYGKIINISSMWGITGASCEVAYSASKSAVIGFTKALAKELGPSNICVNCVAPGVIDTEMNGNLTAEIKRELAEEAPLCRIGAPDEVAQTLLFLASEKADFITGQVVSVNGGFVI